MNVHGGSVEAGVRSRPGLGLIVRVWRIVCDRVESQSQRFLDRMIRIPLHANLESKSVRGLQNDQGWGR